jgi:GH15 family glucan-1,4-alpha-glucosidase
MAYVDESNVLETTFATDQGRLRLVDLMPVRKRQPHAHHLIETLAESAAEHLPAWLHNPQAALQREAGNDVAAAHRIVRLATCLEGEITLSVALHATFDYARLQPTIAPQPLADGAAGAVLSAGGRYLIFLVARLPSNAPGGTAPAIRLEGDEALLRARVSLTTGQRLVVALQYARDASEARASLEMLREHDFEADLDETLAYWREWLSGCQYTGSYQAPVRRSALALKLCTFEPTGAIVAAPTSSLPEAPGGERNWDYRYTWLRDSAFTLGALEALGFHGEARDYFHFLHDLHVRQADHFRIMYGVLGQSGAQLAEQTLDHLEGYKGARPVRIGNGAATQRQLDVYGEVIEAAYYYAMASGFREGGRHQESDRDLRGLFAEVANYVATHCQDLDQGIWEVRGAPRAYVFSRVMCWVALDRACRMAEGHDHHHHIAHWTQARDALRTDILTHGYNQHLESFTQAYGDTVLDAANLRIPLVGFLPGTDERVRNTLRTTGLQLAGPNGLLYRYKRADGAGGGSAMGAAAGTNNVDGLAGQEGAFLACTYWLIHALCHSGQVTEARERFEQMLGYASPLGLYSEEIDPHNGELLGNFPQAFTHIGLINSAVALQMAQEGRLPAI